MPAADPEQPAPGRAWLAALPAELAAQRRAMTALLDRCEAWPLVTSLQVGCSLGRGAADALSDVDAAIGVDVPAGQAAGAPVAAVEALVVAALPELGPLVDVLRHPAKAPGEVRLIFAQYADRTQLDLAVVPGAEIRARASVGGSPDFVPLYQAPVPTGAASAGAASASRQWPAARAVSGDQVREWAFSGWLALLDADKYLRRGSLWEAHARLQSARDQVWALWAAAHGALYPWHGLSQVLDHDPGNLPPGIESTVAGLDPVDLRRAVVASAAVLTAASDAAAARHPAELPAGMARYVTRVLGQGSPESGRG